MGGTRLVSNGLYGYGGPGAESMDLVSGTDLVSEQNPARSTPDFRRSKVGLTGWKNVLQTKFL